MVFIKKLAIVLIFVSLIFLTPSSDQNSRGASIWTDRGCNSTYTVYDPIGVYFITYPGVYFEVWSHHSGKSPQLLAAGTGTGGTGYVTGTVGPPAGEITFVLSMPCTEGCSYCGMCDYGECTVYVIEYQCTCSSQCYGDDLWAMKCVNGVCVKDYIIEENSTQCGHDPCRNVSCGTVCRGYALWSQRCMDGRCVDDHVLETNSISCGYDPCTNIVCGNVCKGYDLWSQTCVNGQCVDSQVVEVNSTQCGFDPCQDHCTNGNQDCGEYGVDCGGGCAFIDSDSDGIEDCRDLCANSLCNRVDTNGCETDADGDGVGDCTDNCPSEKGDASNGGCPSNSMILIIASIGGAILVGSTLIYFGIRGAHPPSPKVIKSTSEDRAIRKELADQIAKETAEKVAWEKTGGKIGEEASTKIGTKIGEEASTEIGTKIGEEASTRIGTKIGEEASTEIGTKIGEEAATRIGTKIGEEAATGVGKEVAGAAGGAGVTGAVAKREVKCPNCGEKLPPDSKFCSKCGQKI